MVLKLFHAVRDKLKNKHVNLFINRLFVLFLILLFSGGLFSQDTLTFSAVLSRIEQLAPATSLQQLSQEEARLKRKNISARLLPQWSLTGQASYQSETTGLDLNFPGFSVPRLSRDQYRLQMELSQVLYDGGTNHTLQHLQSLAGKMDSLKWAMESEQIKELTIQSYFGLLEIQEREKLINVKLEDVTALQSRATVAVNQGTLLQADVWAIEAEKLAVKQQQEEMMAMKMQQTAILNTLMEDTFNLMTLVALPAPLAEGKDLTSQRPAISLMDALSQKATLDKKMDNANAIPKLALFGQLGYGKPGLNFLKNSFTSYYIGGVRLQWNLSEYYNSGRNRQLSLIRSEQAVKQKNQIQKNTSIKIASLRQDMQKLTQWRQDDEKIVQFRKAVREVGYEKWKNGTMTSTDYLLLLSRESEARINLKIHEIQYSKISYLLGLYSGNLLIIK